MKKKVIIPLLLVMAILTSGVAMASAYGVTWKGPDYSNTSGLSWYTPTNIQYWGGYKYSSQSGAWGRHIYASTDATYYNQSRRDSLYSYWLGTNEQYVPTTIHFTKQPLMAALTGLHATDGTTPISPTLSSIPRMTMATLGWKRPMYVGLQPSPQGIATT